MGFTTEIFLFVFLPACMTAYFLMYKLEAHVLFGKLFSLIRGSDLVLIAFGCGFYMWACFDDLARLLAYICTVYLLARRMEHLKRKVGCMDAGGGWKQEFLKAEAEFSFV